MNSKGFFCVFEILSISLKDTKYHTWYLSLGLLTIYQAVSGSVDRYCGLETVDCFNHAFPDIRRKVTVAAGTQPILAAPAVARSVWEFPHTSKRF